MLKRLLIVCLALLGTASLATAADIPTPKGPVILTVSGKISNSNGPAGVTLDAAMLEALPSRVTVATTPWYPQKTRFEGPLGAALLDLVGATGTVLRVTALNDYAVEIPVADLRKWPVILATKIDGKPISVREKGPLFVIYPFDEEPSLYNELYFGRSAWQLKSIEVR
ncbi:hypothetical protein [Bosea sp. (in: a-proteobacteria)]|uniref:hypothetical protein n=1 Tax=Bosea sp. (in: a-proteobacteria) TaxID=1871050 RepID=UPI002737045C|nr:hypothetical protein [Bosea sp. (in: a-proteobacteria)]MDP3407192.1 hypothetical protein [Bosea sp. (in: a-proteobacteria)]